MLGSVATSSTVGKTSLQKQPRGLKTNSPARSGPLPASASTSGHKAAHMAGVKATFGGACTAPPATVRRSWPWPGLYASEWYQSVVTPASVCTCAVSPQGAGETT